MYNAFIDGKKFYIPILSKVLGLNKKMILSWKWSKNMVRKIGVLSLNISLVVLANNVVKGSDSL